METFDRKALYSIGVAAELIGVHQRTLRVYEQEGLITPARRSGKRFYSNHDLQWLKCLRKLMGSDGLNIAGVKKLLTLAPCWSIRNCSEEERKNCPVVLDIPLPCWEIKQRYCGKVECSNCEAYLKKMNHVMTLAASEETQDLSAKD
jgi:MerR family transcriptional regulator, heat shock protein HspR